MSDKGRGDGLVSAVQSSSRTHIRKLDILVHILAIPVLEVWSQANPWDLAAIQPSQVSELRKLSQENKVERD